MNNVWQPYSTAPKDGTRIDLWVKKRLIRNVAWGQAYHGMGHGCGYHEEFWRLDNESGDIAFNPELRPSHWRPHLKYLDVAPNGDSFEIERHL